MVRAIIKIITIAFLLVVQYSCDSNSSDSVSIELEQWDEEKDFDNLSKAKNKLSNDTINPIARQFWRFLEDSSHFVFQDRFEDNRLLFDENVDISTSGFDVVFTPTSGGKNISTKLFNDSLGYLKGIRLEMTYREGEFSKYSMLAVSYILDSNYRAIRAKTFRYDTKSNLSIFEIFDTCQVCYNKLVSTPKSN